MHITSRESLARGLVAACIQADSRLGTSEAFRLRYLQSLVASLIEGTLEDRKFAKKRLVSIIGHGRCLLRAADIVRKQHEVAKP